MSVSRDVIWLAIASWGSPVLAFPSSTDATEYINGRWGGAGTCWPVYVDPVALDAHLVARKFSEEA